MITVFALGIAGGMAFCRETSWESLCVGAIVVNHVVPLHPHELLLAPGIKLWSQP